MVIRAAFGWNSWPGQVSGKNAGADLRDINLRPVDGSLNTPIISTRSLARSLALESQTVVMRTDLPPGAVTHSALPG